MGQYWIPVNLDKKEFIDPHKLGTGLKLWEQLANNPGTGAALVLLCAAMPEKRGGGDLEKTSTNVVGRWAGDRIAIVGDYALDSDLPAEFEASKIYFRCRGYDEVDSDYDDDDGIQPLYVDITKYVAEAIEHELNGKFVGEGWKSFIRNK